MKRPVILLLLFVSLLVPNLRAHLNLADSLEQNEQKLKTDPDNVSYLLHKAHALIIMEQGVKAEGVLKRVDELQPVRDAETMYMYILLYHKEGELEKAFEISDRGIKQFPENPLQWDIRARIARDAGRIEEAITAMTQGLRYRKTVDSSSYFQIIQLLLDRNQAGDKERAAVLLKEGIEKVGNPSELLHLSIRIHTELGCYEQALEDINALEIYNGKQVPFAAKRADVLEAAGRPDEAVDAYKAAIALLDALPEKKQNAQSRQLKTIFQGAIDELSGLSDAEVPSEYIK